MDTQGVLLKRVVYPADAIDRGRVSPRWRRVWLIDGVPLTQLPPPPAGFQLLPRRWVVERTWVWLNQCRRLSKDHERLITTNQALLYAISSRLIVRRLAKK